MQQTTAGATRSVVGLRGALASIPQHLKTIATGFAGFAIIRQVMQTISRFEETLATVRVVSGATAEEFARLEGIAKQLGATTRFSATQAGEGLLFLARAGFSANEAIQALPSTLDLAVAGQLELGRAADIASNVLAQFNLTAAETSRVADVLVSTANSANTNVEQLSTALKIAGPVAGAFNRSLEETAAALGALGNAGIQASLAGTQLRGILASLASLADPTARAEEAMHRLGVTFEQLNPATHTLAEVFETLQKAGLGAEEALAIFQRRQVAGALVLARNVEDLKKLVAANEDAEGTARSNAAVFEGTLKGAYLNLKSAMEALTLATAGSDGFVGALKAVLDTATGAVRILAGMENALAQATPAAVALARAIQSIAMVAAAIVVERVLTFLTALAVTLFRAGAAAMSLGATLAALPLTRVLLVVAALAGVIGGLVEGFSRSDAEAGKASENVRRFADALDAAAEAQRRFNFAREQGRKSEALAQLAEQARAIDEQADSINRMIEAAKKAGDLNPVGVFVSAEMRKLAEQLGRRPDAVATWSKFVSDSSLNSAAKEEYYSQVRLLPLLEELLQKRNALIEQAEQMRSVEQAKQQAERESVRLDEEKVRLLSELQRQQADLADQINEATDLEQKQLQRRRDAEETLAKLAREYGLTATAAARFVGSVDRELSALERQERQIQANEEARQRAIEARRQERFEIESARESLDSMLQTLRDENRLLRVSAEERDILATQLQAERLFRAAAKGATGEELEALHEQVEAIIRLREENERLRREQEQTSTSSPDVRSFAHGLQQFNDELTAMERISIGVGEAISRAMSSAVAGFNNAAEAARNLARSILQIVLQETVGNYVRGLFAPASESNLFGADLGSAHGYSTWEAFAGSFATGGRVDRASLLIAGEQGRENIIPLDSYRDRAVDLIADSALQQKVSLAELARMGVPAFAMGGRVGSGHIGDAIQASMTDSGEIVVHLNQTIINQVDSDKMFKKGLSKNSDLVVNVITDDLVRGRSTSQVIRRQQRRR